tara:strand:+ start:1220 stop:1564 length:345 start_codon:yes stop_codon:yes gene_type:complete
MKITQSQLNKIVKEELAKVKEAAYEPGRAVAGVERSMARTRKHDEWVNPAEGMTDDEIYDKVSASISQIRELLEDAHELARYSPDNQNKGEGAAMADLVRFIDNMYEMYGSESF